MSTDDPLSCPPSLTLQSHLQWRAEQKTPESQTYIIQASGEAFINGPASPPSNGGKTVPGACGVRMEAGLQRTGQTSHDVDLIAAWQRAKPRLLAAAQRQLSSCLSTDSSDDNQPDERCLPQPVQYATPTARRMQPAPTPITCASASVQPETESDVARSAPCCSANPPVPVHCGHCQCIQPPGAHSCMLSTRHATSGPQECPTGSIGAPAPCAHCTPEHASAHMHQLTSQSICCPAARPCVYSATQQPHTATPPSNMLSHATCLHTEAELKLRHATAALQHHIYKAKAVRPQLSTSKPRSRRESPHTRPRKCTFADHPVRCSSSPPQPRSRNRGQRTHLSCSKASDVALHRAPLEEGIPVLHKMAKRLLCGSDSSDSPASIEEMPGSPNSSHCSYCPASTSRNHCVKKEAPSWHQRSSSWDDHRLSDSSVPPDYPTRCPFMAHSHRDLSRAGTAQDSQSCPHAPPRIHGREVGGSSGRRGTARRRPRSAGPMSCRQELHTTLLSGWSEHRSAGGEAARQRSRARSHSGDNEALVDAVDSALAALRQRTAQLRLRDRHLRTHMREPLHRPRLRGSEHGLGPGLKLSPSISNELDTNYGPSSTGESRQQVDVGSSPEAAPSVGHSPYLHIPWSGGLEHRPIVAPQQPDTGSDAAREQKVEWRDNVYAMVCEDPVEGPGADVKPTVETDGTSPRIPAALTLRRGPQSQISSNQILTPALRTPTLAPAAWIPGLPLQKLFRADHLHTALDPWTGSSPYLACPRSFMRWSEAHPPGEQPAAASSCGLIPAHDGGQPAAVLSCMHVSAHDGVHPAAASSRMHAPAHDGGHPATASSCTTIPVHDGVQPAATSSHTHAPAHDGEQQLQNTVSSCMHMPPPDGRRPTTACAPTCASAPPDTTESTPATEREPPARADPLVPAFGSQLSITPPTDDPGRAPSGRHGSEGAGGGAGPCAPPACNGSGNFGQAAEGGEEAGGARTGGVDAAACMARSASYKRDATADAGQDLVDVRQQQGSHDHSQGTAVRGAAHWSGSTSQSRSDRDVAGWPGAAAGTDFTRLSADTSAAQPQRSVERPQQACSTQQSGLGRAYREDVSHPVSALLSPEPAEAPCAHADLQWHARLAPGLPQQPEGRRGGAAAVGMHMHACASAGVASAGAPGSLFPRAPRRSASVRPSRSLPAVFPEQQELRAPQGVGGDTVADAVAGAELDSAERSTAQRGGDLDLEAVERVRGVPSAAAAPSLRMEDVGSISRGGDVAPSSSIPGQSAGLQAAAQAAAPEQRDTCAGTAAPANGQDTTRCVGEMDGSAAPDPASRSADEHVLLARGGSDRSMGAAAPHRASGAAARMRTEPDEQCSADALRKAQLAPVRCEGGVDVTRVATGGVLSGADAAIPQGSLGEAIGAESPVLRAMKALGYVPADGRSVRDARLDLNWFAPSPPGSPGRNQVVRSPSKGGPAGERGSGLDRRAAGTAGAQQGHAMTEEASSVEAAASCMSQSEIRNSESRAVPGSGGRASGGPGSGESEVKIRCADDMVQETKIMVDETNRGALPAAREEPFGLRAGHILGGASLRSVAALRHSPTAVALRPQAGAEGELHETGSRTSKLAALWEQRSGSPKALSPSGRLPSWAGRYEIDLGETSRGHLFQTRAKYGSEDTSMVFLHVMDHQHLALILQNSMDAGTPMALEAMPVMPRPSDNNAS